MSDLINRQDTIDAVTKYCLQYDLRELLAEIEILPSAQPERKTGKWIIRTRHEHFPSGKEYTELVCPFCGRTDHNGDGIFCGYCGCKMEVEDETD